MELSTIAAAPPKPEIGHTLDRLWERFLPQLQARATVLTDAGTALGAGHLSLNTQRQACEAAHKLAGVLGTFGLNRGTDLARKLELLYSAEGTPKAALAPLASAMARELCTLIENRA